MGGLLDVCMGWKNINNGKWSNNFDEMLHYCPATPRGSIMDLSDLDST